MGGRARRQTGREQCRFDLFEREDGVEEGCVLEGARGAAVLEAVLGPGDLVFTPAATPHAARNPAFAIALSGNIFTGHDPWQRRAFAHGRAKFLWERAIGRCCAEVAQQERADGPMREDPFCPRLEHCLAGAGAALEAPPRPLHARAAARGCRQVGLRLPRQLQLHPSARAICRAEEESGRQWAGAGGGGAPGACELAAPLTSLARVREACEGGDLKRSWILRNASYTAAIGSLGFHELIHADWENFVHDVPLGEWRELTLFEHSGFTGPAEWCGAEGPQGRLPRLLAAVGSYAARRRRPPRHRRAATPFTDLSFARHKKRHRPWTRKAVREFCRDAGWRRKHDDADPALNPRHLSHLLVATGGAGLTDLPQQERG